MEVRLLVLGDLCVDIIHPSGPARYGEEHELGDLDFSIGGCAANFAITSAILGMRPVLISAIGRDFATGFLRSRLSEAGVKPLLIESRQKNAFSIIALDKAGERSIQSESNCLHEITAKKAERMLHAVNPGDFLFISGFYQLDNMRPGFAGLLKKLDGRKAVICFDTSFDMHGKWDISAYLPFIDYLFVNEVEIRHVAKGANAKERASYLLSKGAGNVILKQGAGGATLFRKYGDPVKVKALKVRAVDTTGAGDAFNAGFVFGLMRGWSLHSCMLSAVYAASEKVKHHGPFCPGQHAIERFARKRNGPDVIISRDYNGMSSAAASIVREILGRNPEASFALPTGTTPRGLYGLLSGDCKRGRADFSKARFFALDEYAGLGKSDENSFSHYLMNNFIKKVNARRDSTRLLNGAASDLKRECLRHEAVIRRNGIDLCILGIGRNGHIAFNEPGSPAGSRTRVVNLSQGTRKANGNGFPDGLAPPKALTVGIGTILENSRRIILLASGRHKADAVAAALSSGDIGRCPAAALRRHMNVTFILDREAAGKTKKQQR